MGTHLEIIYGIIVDFLTSICVNISNADIKNIVTQYLTKSSQGWQEKCKYLIQKL